MKNRTDIQALRGYAVLLVVLHHAKLAGLSAGYLGVDVFFVISGFLITGMIRDGIRRGDFSFTEFYFRRAKRLLPAAYATFLLTVLLAPWFVDASEYRNVFAQLVGALTFSANFILWKQAGYFSIASELKPLLHVWSLAIEEQYYLLVPAALFLIAPRRWLPAALCVLVGSLALYVAGEMLKPSAAFYLLPTRAWELALGSVGALIGMSEEIRRWVGRLFAPAVLAMIAMPVAPFADDHPVPVAVTLCLATLVLILRRHPWLNSARPAGLLGKVGDFSYSLYLVHWPIFAYANNATVSEPPGQLSVGVRVGAVVVAVLLGYAMYRLIEQPIRRADFRPRWRFGAAAIAASVALVLVGAGLLRESAEARAYAEARRINFGLSRRCEFGDQFAPLPDCKTSDSPSVLVWGDSYAMHLVPGIVVSSDDRGVIQATRSGCGPVLGLAPIERPSRREQVVQFDEAWARGCLRFNASVVSYLEEAPSVSTVVLASLFDQYLDSERWRALTAGADGPREDDAGVEHLMSGLRDTVMRIRAMGKRVVVVAPPPTGGFNTGRCLERSATGKVLLGAHDGCVILVGDYRQTRARVLTALERAGREAGVGVLSMDGFLCDAQFCQVQADRVPLYRDAGHLSVDGSRLVGKRMSLTATLVNLAR
ncbi:MAG: acyltransferase family protein [Steroidobacteraceae bacterium]